MGRRSLVGHSPQGHKELDTTEAAAHARTVLTYTYPKTKILKEGQHASVLESWSLWLPNSLPAQRKSGTDSSLVR